MPPTRVGWINLLLLEITFLMAHVPSSSSSLPAASSAPGLFHSSASPSHKPPMVDLPGTAGQQLPVHHGTTTLAFVIDEGIICAVDSRASLGSLVGSRTTDKVLPVTSRVLGTMAGGAADCGYWIRVLSARVRLWELEEGRPASVRMVAHLLVEMLRGQRGLSVGTMIMGHSCGGDEEDAGEDGPGVGGEPGLFYVDSSGTCMEGSVFAVGSGSVWAISVIDAERRADMGWDAATDLAIRALQRATHRDAFSGGFLNVFHISKRDGLWKQVHRIDSSKLPFPPG